MSYQPIENYGVIGDLHTVALVGMDGSIDFLCFPELDSPTVFAALLDSDKGGRFRIAPTYDEGSSRQIYLPDTNILLTRFSSEGGIAELSDFMPVEEQDEHPDLIRRIKVVRGELTFRMLCQPRFDYARGSHRVERVARDELLFVADRSEKDAPSALRLRASVPLETRNGDGFAEFKLSSNDHAWFVLEMAEEGNRKPVSDDYVSDCFKTTANYWRHWSASSRYQGRWREMVMRSALVLKLLTSQRHGTMAAAPTFGLPEVIGGSRNWDYRYSWIRDAAFSMYALMRLGYTEETEGFMQWIEDRCRELEPDGSLQVLYTLSGQHEIEETMLDHLEGYRGSSPVRIGNGAANQLQLDIYGELMDSVYIFDRFGYPIAYDLWSHLVELLSWVEKNWERVDRSIWEVRGESHHFLYSRMMCWVAFDRAVRLARKRSLPAPLTRWTEVRDTIHQQIFTEFWNEQKRTFVQFMGAERTDAALLLMPLVKFVSPRDPRWLATLDAVQKELAVDALVYRYADSHSDWDGLPGTEGTFSMCSFWLVEAISRTGDLEQARFQFEKMLGYANHLGLYAEQLGPCGEHLGNYPQAFTHLALISAAFDLDRRLDRVDAD